MWQLAVQVVTYKGAYVIGCDVEKCRQEILDNGAYEVVCGKEAVQKKFRLDKRDIILWAVTITEDEVRDYFYTVNKGGERLARAVELLESGAMCVIINRKVTISKAT